MVFGSVESESRKRFQVIGNSVLVYIVQQNKPGNGDRERCINLIQLLDLTLDLAHVSSVYMFTRRPFMKPSYRSYPFSYFFLFDFSFLV